MPFQGKWSDDVKRAVRDASVSPAQPSARQIWEGLGTGAFGRYEPDEIPPRATVATWVTEARRTAREAVEGATPSETLRTIDILERRARHLARNAKNAKQIQEAAGAIVAVERARGEVVKRRGDAERAALAGRKPSHVPDSAQAAADPDAFARSLAAQGDAG